MSHRLRQNIERGDVLAQRRKQVVLRVERSFIHIEHLLQRGESLSLVSATVDSVIFEDDSVISTSVETEKLAVAVLFWSNAIKSDFVLQLLKNLFGVIVNCSESKDVKNEQESMISGYFHLGAHKKSLVASLDQMDILRQLLGSE